MHCAKELRGGDLAIRSSNPFLRRKMVKNDDRDHDYDENDDEATLAIRSSNPFFRR